MKLSQASQLLEELVLVVLDPGPTEAVRQEVELAWPVHHHDVKLHKVHCIALLPCAPKILLGEEVAERPVIGDAKAFRSQEIRAPHFHGPHHSGPFQVRNCILSLGTVKCLASVRNRPFDAILVPLTEHCT